MASKTLSETVLSTEPLYEHLIHAIRRAGIYNRSAMAKPKAILWPDKDKQWLPLMPIISAAMPELWMATSNGEAVPEQCRGGSAALLRYATQRDARPEVADRVPVIYLPGIERADFRSPETFSREHRHLYPLHHQGTFFAMASGRDWTPVGFLTSKDSSVSLDVPSDNKTKEALLRHLVEVFHLVPHDCRGKVLNAQTLVGLFTPDPIRGLLEWIVQGNKIKQLWGAAQWEAFISVAQTDYKIQPQNDVPLAAAEKLVEGGGKWDKVWARFCESPNSFKGILPVLDQVIPKSLFGAAEQRIPSRNNAHEKELAQELESLARLPVKEARTKLESLVIAHGQRADGPWALLGKAPLAKAVVKLGKMLEAMKVSIHVTDWQITAKNYLNKGWKVDLAARQSIAETQDPASYKAVSQALQGVYKPWLMDLAERVQQHRESYPLRDVSKAVSLPNTPGTLVLFVDGLRADVAMELVELLKEEELNLVTEVAWAALPTVTATAKPAFQPVAAGLGGGSLSDGFEPVVLAKGKACKTEDVRTLLKQNGFAVLGKDDLGDPNQAAWLEVGNLDSLGHSEGGKLAKRVGEELRGIVQKIKQLLDYGWREVKVVTDHGWLWLPSGLPHVDLPGHLTASKWGRCAVSKPGSLHGLPTVPWFWGNEHDVVVPPGINVFIKNTEYSHGGVSLQECLKVHLTITAAGKALGHVKITEAKWSGLRLKVTLEGARLGLSVDLRGKAADANSSLLLKEPSEPDGSGHLTLVADDDKTGHQAVLVVIEGGKVIAKQSLTVGEN